MISKQSVPETLRETGIRLLIKHRIFAPYDHTYTTGSTKNATTNAL